MRPQPRYQPGDKIGGRYQVHQALMGGMGEVYLCLDLETIQPYALKTFQQRHSTNPRLRTAFENEVATWIALEKHPNIVRCFYMDILDNQPFMVLEWIANYESRGTDLRSWLRHCPLDLRLALDFAIDICRGLIHAQQKQQGIVHRDLKPENILIAQGGLAKITDWGLAKVVHTAKLEIANAESEINGLQSLLGVDGIPGTPPYMAPEQWRREELDFRTDIYAVGCTLYEMLSGGWPFRATTVGGLRRQHLEADIPKLADGQTWPDSLNTLLACCLAKRREERFATVQDLLQQLTLIYEQQSTEPPRVLPVSGEFTAMDYNNRGVTYYRLQRYDEALADYNQAIQLDLDSAMAYTNRGSIYRNLKRYDEALADYNRAIQFDPTFVMAYYNRGNAYRDLQQYEKALVDYNQAIQLDPSYAQAHTNRGNTHYDLQLYDEALVDYNRAIQLDPTRVTAYINRGNTHYDLQRYDEALVDYDRVIQLDPSYAQAHTNRGNTYYALQRYDEALVDYNRAIQLDPTCATAYINRGNTYDALQRYEEALADYNRAIQLDPNDAIAYTDRGSIYRNLERYDEALLDYNQAVQIAPTFTQAYRSRGLTYYELQRYEEALADYNCAIQLDLTSATTYYNRGLTYEKLQLYDEALRDYSRAIELDPNYAQAYSNRGNTYYALQRYAEALRDFSRAIELDPNDAHAYSNRGNTYAALQRYAEALRDYCRAIELDPNCVQAYSNRGTTYSDLQRYDEALRDFSRAIELDPNDAQAYLNLGALLGNQGMYQEALPYFEKAAQLGLPQGAQYAAMARQALGMETVPPVDPAQQAFEAFQQTGSAEAMQQAVARFPFMAQADFIAAVERATAQQVPSHLRPAFKQRLAWLRQIANEQKREERNQ